MNASRKGGKADAGREVNKEAGGQRVFVTVSAQDERHLRRLQPYGFDLFAHTAKKHPQRRKDRFSIEGLLSSAQIRALEKAGYKVKIDAAMEERSVKPGETLELDEWLRQVQTRVGADRQVK
jgi:hypothetical protein